jgi:hypothetical protein
MSLPELVLTCDPDSSRSAIAWAISRTPKTFAFVDVIGGGTGKPVSWQTISGMVPLLAGLHADVDELNMTIVCETQAPDGPRSADVELLRRVRYHWEATCEITGAKFVSVEPFIWERAFVTDRGRLSLPQGKGSLKAAYQKRAKELTPLATNEDRCATIGMLDWYVRSIGATLVFP